MKDSTSRAQSPSASTKATAARLVIIGLWIVAIKDKSPDICGGGWGLTRKDIQEINRLLTANPGAGLGVCLGPGRGPGGRWIIDLEGDGPLAEDSLTRLCGGLVVKTMSWSSSRGNHYIFIVDGKRLLELLSAAGATVVKGHGKGKGVYKLPEFPDLEIRCGGYLEDGKTVKQFQSVIPPTAPRQWIHEPQSDKDIAELPEAAYASLEAVADAKVEQAVEQQQQADSRGNAAWAGTVDNGVADQERLARYLATMNPAISGQGGHNATIRAAAMCVRFGFDQPEQVFCFLRDHYNPRCTPVWSEKELRHKAEDACKKETRRDKVGSQHYGARPSSNGKYQAQPDSPIINNRKTWVSCHHNSKIWLAGNGLGGKIFYDRFHRMVYVDGKRLDDEIVIKLAGQIEKALRVPWGQEHVRSAMIDIAYDHQRSAIEDWLNPLQWDQVPRIDSFFEVAYGCKRQDYNAACSKVLFLSGVARAFDPGCKADVMPVLIGPQGIGKSFGMRALCPVPDWHTDDGIGNLNDRKATGEGLQGKWIVEFSEFTRINRSTLETIKAFVSRQFDHYRPSYGRTSKDFPRSCVFVGTTNDKYPLHDVENRRFMPVRCVQGDIPWIEANRDQLWAEACTRYKAGEKWWITDPALIKVCRQKQEAARLDDAWETILANGLAGIDTITAAQVAKIVGVEPERLDRSTQTRLGLALDRLGFTRRRKRVGKLLTYEWIRRGVVPTCPF